MIDVKSYVGNLEIIYNGNAHLFHNKTISINLVNNLKIEISYVIDSNIESKINWSLTDNILKIIFENYASQLGGGILEPWLIGTYNGKQLLITIFSKLIDDGTSQYISCDYILYSGKEVANG